MDSRLDPLSSRYRNAAEKELCDYFNYSNAPILAMPTKESSPVQGVKVIYRGAKPIIPQEFKELCVLLVCVDNETFSKMLLEIYGERKTGLASEIKICAPSSFFSTPISQPVISSPCAPQSFFSKPK